MSDGHMDLYKRLLFVRYGPLLVVHSNPQARLMSFGTSMIIKGTLA